MMSPLMVRQGRGIVQPAIQTGELPPAANHGLIMDLMIEGIINHIISTPRRLRRPTLERSDACVLLMASVVRAAVQPVPGEARHD